MVRALVRCLNSSKAVSAGIVSTAVVLSSFQANYSSINNDYSYQNASLKCTQQWTRGNKKTTLIEWMACSLTDVTCEGRRPSSSKWCCCCGVFVITTYGISMLGSIFEAPSTSSWVDGVRPKARTTCRTHLSCWWWWWRRRARMSLELSRLGSNSHKVVQGHILVIGYGIRLVVIKITEGGCKISTVEHPKSGYPRWKGKWRTLVKSNKRRSHWNASRCVDRVAEEERDWNESDSLKQPVVMAVVMCSWCVHWVKFWRRKNVPLLLVLTWKVC